MILPALAPRRRTREAAFFGALTLFSFCLAACDGSGGEPNDSADERLRRAAELARNDQEVPAARLLVDGIERFSRADQARLHAYAARYYYSAGVVSDALRNAQRARDLGTDSTAVLYIIGDSLRRNRRLREARAVLESVLQRDPSHSLAKLSLGSLMVREEDDPARALPLFQGYLEKPSSNPAVHEQALLEYGRALRAAKRYQEAADQFALLLERRPTDRSLYSELASTMYRMRLREHGRLFETIYSGLSEGAFEEAAEGRLKREGRAAQAIAQEALNLTERMHYLEAYRKHRRALSLDETDVRIPAYFAGFLNDLRRGRDAVAVLDRALEKRRLPSSGLWYSRGTVLTDLDDSRGALKAFEKAIESLREETSRGITGGFVVGQAVASRTRFALGRAYLNVGALAAATTLFDALARELPRAWEPSYWRGRIRLEEGNASAAAALFREARDRGGGSLPDLRYWNAVALSRSGRRQEAAQAFQQLIQNEPGRLESYEELAKLLPPGENRREVIAARDRVDRTRRSIEEVVARIGSTPLEKCASLYARLGELHREIRDRRAIRYLFLASDLDPRNVDVCRRLVSALTRNQETFIRLRFLRRILAVDPDDRPALSAFAAIYAKMHVRLGEAERCARRFHELEGNAASYRLLAQVQLTRGKTPDARELLEEAATKHPGDPEIRRLLDAARGTGG